MIPIIWLFVQSPLGGVLASIYSGSVWSGHDLANFNVQLDLAPEKNRASYIAVNTVLTSLCAAIGPAIGGVITDAIGYSPLFVASAVLRFGAALMLLLVLRNWSTAEPGQVAAGEKIAPDSR